jgi:YggT family protein
MLEIIQILNILVNLVVFAIVGRSLLSWFVRDPTHPLMRVLIDVTEPILGPIRSRLPSSWMIDLSPLIAIIVIQVVWRLIAQIALS